MKVKGKIPLKGPILIAAHHEGLADQYIIVIQTKRRLFWVADTTSPSSNTSLVDQKFKKWLLFRLGAIPIDKKNPKRNAHLFEYLLFLLKRGEAIVFFPEAYLRDERNGKKFGEFKDGIVKLALEYEKRFNKKIPVYPIGLSYKGKRIKRAYLNIGNVISIESIKDKNKLFNEIKKLS